MTETPLNAETVSRDIAQRLRERIADPRKIWGIPWGFPGLDSLTGGIHAEEMSVVMARPGVGKTNFMGQVAVNVAEYLVSDEGKQRFPKKCVKLVLCEMSAQSFQERLVAAKSGVSLRRMSSGQVTPAERDRVDAAAEELAKLPIFYLDEPSSLENTLKWLQQDPKPAWFAVDYLGIHPTGPGNDSQYARVSRLSSGFRDFCKRYAPGLILAQMNRECEKRDDPRPRLSDLRDSGSVEQDAWNVMGLHRDDVFLKVADEDRNRPKPASLHFLKHRRGPLGTVELLWVPTKMAFRDVTKVVEEAEG